MWRPDSSSTAILRTISVFPVFLLTKVILRSRKIFLTTTRAIPDLVIPDSFSTLLRFSFPTNGNNWTSTWLSSIQSLRRVTASLLPGFTATVERAVVPRDIPWKAETLALVTDTMSPQWNSPSLQVPQRVSKQARSLSSAISSSLMLLFLMVVGSETRRTTPTTSTGSFCSSVRLDRGVTVLISGTTSRFSSTTSHLESPFNQTSYLAEELFHNDCFTPTSAKL